MLATNQVFGQKQHLICFYQCFRSFIWSISKLYTIDGALSFSFLHTWQNMIVNIQILVEIFLYCLLEEVHPLRRWTWETTCFPGSWSNLWDWKLLPSNFQKNILNSFDLLYYILFLFASSRRQHHWFLFINYCMPFREVQIYNWIKLILSDKF